MTDQMGRVETYSYDRMDKPISVTDRKGQTTGFTYDILSRIMRTTYADGSFIEYSYDGLGRIAEINDTASGMITYVYDNLDRMVAESTAMGMVSYEYDGLGKRVKMTVAGQPSVDYAYDAGGRLTGITQGTQTVSINHDSVGRRAFMTLPNSLIAAYSYDNGNHLTDINYSSPLQILKSLNYVYDQNGNRTSFSGHQTLLPGSKTAAYNQANQQIQVDTENLVYDENGNLIRKGDTAFTWDARNRLVAITGPAYNASFKYDALGRRIEKTINGKNTAYLYDGWDIVQEIESGVVTTNYMRGLNMDETLGISRSEGTYYYLTDALGSTIALTDTNGSIAAEYYYDPFGKTETSNSVVYNPFQYTGRENDGNSIYHYRMRYKIGERFISEDPIGFNGGSINLYEYVGNSPVNYRDPYGLIYGAITAKVLELLGMASEATPVAGAIVDTLLGAGLSMAGMDEVPCEEKLGVPYRLVQGWGGLAGLRLGMVIAATSPSAGYVLPIVLAGAGGWIIGDTINDLIRDATGESMSDYMAEGLYILEQRHRY